MSNASEQSIVQQHLRVELQWLSAMLQLHLRRMQSQGLLPPPKDPFPGTSVAPTEVEARLERGKGDIQSDTSHFEAAGLAALEAAEKEREALVASVADPVATLPLIRIREVFQLQPTEYLLLLLTLAPEFDPTFPRLYAYLQNHFERQYATLALLADCLMPPGESSSVRGLLDETGTLRKFALVRLAPGRPETAVLHRPLLANTRIVRYAQGSMDLDADLESWCRLWPAASQEGETRIPPTNQPDWDRLWRIVDDTVDSPGELPVFIFRGPDGVGKHRWAQEMSTKLGMQTLLVDLVALLRTYEDAKDGLAVILREARLQSAVACFEHWEELAQPDLVPVDEKTTRVQGRGPEVTYGQVFQKAFHGDRAVMAFLVEDMHIPLPNLRREMEVFDLDMPDTAMSQSLWDEYLPKAMRGPGVTPARLAADYRLTPGQIREAVDYCFGRIAVSGDTKAKVTSELLSETIKEQVRHRLGDNATLVRGIHDWSDLILPQDVVLQLREFCSRFYNRSKVLDGWGFGARFGSNMGLTCLFDGPPGTGKTMAASIIAKELGLDLYKIDLSRVVSRYVGETEKNLSRIFDEADRARAMLLFDEADSLFSKRTEVQNSNDRYANLEVNYLLQRVESFSGVAVLTTNFSTSMDDAFKRRLSMRVSFPKPEVPERERLWRSMLGERSMVDSDIDYKALADEYELAGGHIRNAVLRAAYIAASRDLTISDDLVDLSARIEMKEQGMVVHGNPISELWEDDSRREDPDLGDSDSKP
ncbi:MAG: hypothetical protein CMH54_09325 [Myxococcales bacterium]|nr:hypothetical protein [Myxococcales bacterium]